MKIRSLGVIPARYGSQRFPGKPLTPIADKTLVQRVYEQAAKAARLDKVIVATEDTRILEAVEAFGGDAMLTSPDCATGTDRVAEVASPLQCPARPHPLRDRAYPHPPLGCSPPSRCGVSPSK